MKPKHHPVVFFLVVLMVSTLVLVWTIPSSQRLSVVIGLATGLLASFAIVYWYEVATQPKLEIREDPGDPYCADFPFKHCFHHVHVKHLKAGWPFSSRRPAWAARATLDVYAEGKERPFLAEVVGRWAGTPEPVTPVAPGHLVVDVTKIVHGEKIDIHYNHPGEQLDIAIEIEDKDWYVFNNLNYRDPAWRYAPNHLLPGTYRIKIRVFYESGVVEYWKSLVTFPRSMPTAPLKQGPPESTQRPSLSSRSTD